MKKYSYRNRALALLAAAVICGTACARQPVRKTVRYPHDRANLDLFFADRNRNDPWKIVCYGDSLTFGFTRDGSGQAEETWPETLEMFLRKRYPRVKVINEGHNGWTSEAGLDNLESLVLSRKPDMVVLLFGTNDAVRVHDVDEYRKNMEKMISVLEARKIQAVLATPLPLNNEFNERLIPFITELRNLQESRNIPFVNLHYAFIRMIRSREEFSRMFPDTVHPAPEYYPVMGKMIYMFLKQ